MSKPILYALSWGPDFARGNVRVFRVRWALEESGRDYETVTLHGGQARTAEYLSEQPFEQVPAFRDGDVRLFESGAIVLHIGATCEALLPAAPAERARAMAWTFAALNTVEPILFELSAIDFFHKGEAWTEARRPQVVAHLGKRLDQLAAHLGAREWLEAEFTAGDLLMADVLRMLAQENQLGDWPALAAYVDRASARPAFVRARDAHFADFTAPAPQPA